MKKSLLILSMAAIAANAVAFDQPVAGTADAPNYYVIKANRGVPYLAYTAEAVEATNGLTTNLTRTETLSAANVWAVTSGTADGSLVFKSYVADAYLMNFFKTDGATVAAGAVANTVADPVDIFAVAAGDGAYAININSATGAAYPDNCISLDAPGGTAVYCGNYMPTAPANGEGSCWWFTKVTPAPGQTMEDAILAVVMAPEVDAAVEVLNAYKTNVPQVASELQAGIDQLGTLTPTADFATRIAGIKDAAIAAANTALETVLADKVFALKNLRRVTTATEGAYLVADKEAGRYAAGTTYVPETAAFTFKASANGGYVLYNAASDTYFGSACTPVATEAEAQVLYPVLAASAPYYGVALSNNADKTGTGLNWQSWDNGAISFWDINDPGDVWSLVTIDYDQAVAEVAAAVEAALSPYIPNVYPVKEILETAIADAKALTFSADLAERAAAIQTKAFEDAAAVLAEGLDNKVFALKYLRGGDYVAVGAGADDAQNFIHTNEVDNDALFTLKAVGEGGYKLFNAQTGVYVGPGEVVGGHTVLALVTDEAAAETVYPVLQRSGDYYGVAFPFSADKTGAGINMNADQGLKSYSIADAGSIWGLIDPSVSAIVESVNAVAAPVREGIYDLSGRKLSAPVRGINIINGKKVLVK